MRGGGEGGGGGGGGGGRRTFQSDPIACVYTNACILDQTVKTNAWKTHYFSLLGVSKALYRIYPRNTKGDTNRKASCNIFLCIFHIGPGWPKATLFPSVNISTGNIAQPLRQDFSDLRLLARISLYHIHRITSKNYILKCEQLKNCLF